MKNYELYIDGHLFDLESNFEFGMIYQSPIFTDISNIISNRTTTIKIPKTTNNLTIINNCQMLDNTEVFPYKSHNIELLKNGIQIINKGTAYIISISEQIEMSIIWGVNIDMYLIKNLKLREMPLQDEIIWDLSNSLKSYSDNYGLAIYKPGNFNKYDSTTFIHPVVSLRWIVETIQQLTGISVTMPSRIDTLYQKLYIPLIDNNPLPINNSDCKFKFSGNFDIDVNSDPNGYYNSDSKSLVVKEDCLVTISGSFTWADPTFQLHWRKLRIYKNGSEIFSQKIDPENAFDLSLENIRCKAGDYFQFSIEVRWGLWPILHTVMNPNGLTVDGELNFTTNPVEVNWFEKYPIVINLPDMTGYDILQTLMQMFGLFPVCNKDNEMQLYSLDDVYERKSFAKDWTDKIVTGSNINTLTFSIKDFAQKNLLSYADDDNVEMSNTDINGFVEMDNNLSDKEKDYQKLKFSASGTSIDGKAIIPIYTTYIDESGNLVLEKNDIKNNRIISVEFENFNPDDSEYPNGYPFGYFSNEMFFGGESGLINTYYSKLKSLIYHPKAIEIQAKLSEIDLYNIDLLTPIYLEQTGYYYAIIKIEEQDGKAKVELLQMYD